MINIHPDMWCYEGLTDELEEFDGMVCLACFIKNTKHKELVFLDEMGEKITRFLEDGKWCVLVDKNLKKYLETLGTELDSDNKIKIGGCDLRFKYNITEKLLVFDKEEIKTEC